VEGSAPNPPMALRPCPSHYLHLSAHHYLDDPSPTRNSKAKLNMEANATLRWDSMESVPCIFPNWQSLYPQANLDKKLTRDKKATYWIEEVRERPIKP